MTSNFWRSVWTSVKVKSKNHFYFTDFFAKIYSLLTHVRSTPPLRSHYCIFCQWFVGLFSRFTNLGHKCGFSSLSHGGVCLAVSLLLSDVTVLSYRAVVQLHSGRFDMKKSNIGQFFQKKRAVQFLQSFLLGELDYVWEFQNTVVVMLLNLNEVIIVHLVTVIGHSCRAVDHLFCNHFSRKV